MINITAKEAAELAANYSYIKEALESAEANIRAAAERGETETDKTMMSRSASTWAVGHVIEELQAAGYDAEELPIPEIFKGDESTWSYWRYFRISWASPRATPKEYRICSAGSYNGEH